MMVIRSVSHVETLSCASSPRGVGLGDVMVDRVIADLRDGGSRDGGEFVVMVDRLTVVREMVFRVTEVPGLVVS